MYDEISLNIMAIFLCAVTGILAHHLVRRRGLVTPSGFVAFSFLFLALEGVCIALIGMHHPLLATGIALGIALSLVNTVCATCFFVGCLFLRPWEALPQNGFLLSLPKLLAGLTLAVWALFAIKRRSLHVIWNTPCILFVLFIVWLALCALVAGNTVSPSFSFFIESFVPISVLSFLILNSLRATDDLHLFIKTLVTSVLGVIAVALYTTLRDYSVGPDYHRLHSLGLWGNANDLAAMAVCVLPLSLAPFLIKSKTSWKGSILSLGVSLLLALGILWSESRGALAAIMAAVACYLLFCKAKQRAGILLAGCLLFLPVLVLRIIQRESADLEGSNSSRFNYLIAGLKMVKSHPVFGVGVNNYSYLYEQYTPAFFEWGTRTAHSSWVLVLAEAGIIGFVLFASLYFTIGRYAWRIRKVFPQALLIMVAYGVTMSFLSHTYIFLPYVVMSFVLAASKVYLDETKSYGP